MEKQMNKTKCKIIRNIIITTLVALVLLCSTLVVFAYFSTQVKLYTDDGQTEYLKMGMELNTFFDRINSGTTSGTAITDGTDLGIVCTDTSVATAYTSGAISDTNTYYTEISAGVYHYVYNSSAVWGSASNPYLISKVNHLQNLYVLQNCGYFTQVTDTGITENCMPYFLVCSSIGTPVTINGENKTYEYIGNDTYPFIGYVGGSFVSGTTTVDGKSSSQSVIYNLVSITDSNIIDVGLFGRIGYLGDDSILTDGKFNGSVSTVRNLLLYDVQIKVQSKSTWDSIIDLIAHHLFSYSGTKNNDGTYNDNDETLTAKENHHVGILAGHVDYATVEYISVYYSNDSTAAIDVKHVEKSASDAVANYYSVSGILGFVNEMNSAQSNGKVTIGGVSNEDIAISAGGAGTGGGLISGTGRGYVTAAEVYETYNDSGQIVKCTITDGEEVTYKYGIVIEVNVDLNAQTITGTLSDGKTPVSVENDNGAIVAVIETSYSNFFGGTETDKQKWREFVLHYDGKYYYYATSTNALTEATQVTTTGISLKYGAVKDLTTNEFTRLCVQYERDRIGSTLIGWTQTTDRFYFYDGVFTFAISETTDTIEETWKGEVGKIKVGLDDDNSWTQDESALPNSVVAFMLPITSEEQLRSGKEIFIAYKDASGNYHLVTLNGNSTYNAGGNDDAVYTNQTTMSLVDNNTRIMIKSSLDNNTLTLESTSSSSLAQIKSNWDQIQILNVGNNFGGITLEQLKTMYQVKVTAQQQDITAGTYEDDGTTPITQALSASAQATSTILQTYYAITSVSDVSTYTDTLHNRDYTYFSLNSNPTTANLTNVWNALNTFSGQYYPNSNVTATTTNSFSYLKITNSATVSFANVVSAINDKNATYYQINSVSSIKGTNPTYFTKTGNNTANISQIQTAIDTYNSTLYQADGSSAVATSLRNQINLDASGTQISQAENKVYTNGYYYFYTFDVGVLAVHYRLFFVDASGSVTTVIKSQYGYGSGWEGDLYDMFYSHHSITDVDGKTTIMVKKNKNDSIEYPFLYELDGTYYRTFHRNTSSSDYISGDLQAQFENSTVPRYRMIVPFTAKYDYIVKTISGSGISYTFNGLSNTCTNVTSANKSFSAIAQGTLTTTLYGTNYPVYSCTYSGATKEAILFVRYQIDGIMLQTSTGTGVTYSLINGSTGNAISGKTLGSSFTEVSGSKISANGTQYQIYRNNNYLGVRVAKFGYDRILLETSTGTGIKYDVLNLSGQDIGDSKSSITDTGETVTIGGVTHKVYISNGHLGIRLAKVQMDGIMLQTMTGNGVTYSLVNGSGTTLSSMASNSTLIATDNTITVDGLTYVIYQSGGKMGVRVANFKIDGYITANVTSAGTTYKLNDTTVLDIEPVAIPVTYPLSNGTTTKYYNLYISGNAQGNCLGIKFIHNEAGQPYYYKFWHTSSDPNDPYVLRALRRAYVFNSYYGIVVGDNDFVENAGNFGSGVGACRGVSNSTDCTVVFNSDGTACLKYVVNGYTRYLRYDTTNNHFDSATSSSDAACHLYLFTVEGTHDSSISNKIVPIAGTQVGNDYAADQYVLWPNNIYLSTDSSTSGYNPTNGYIADTSYSLKSLAELRDNGWNDGTGHTISLSQSDLHKVFSLGDGISDVNMMNLWGGNTGTILGSDNYVKAPIGTNGEQAYIPTGCIAFKTNTTNENNKIRVIIAVPYSEYYYGQTTSGSYMNPAADTGIDYSTDYCFCMWKIDEANSSSEYSFSVSNCYASFELPRSAPYDPDDLGTQYYSNISGNSLSVTTTGTTNQSVKKYINITMGGNTYRAYLNGDEVLVAYEFVAKEEGIYLLGSTKECRIVFFSADATASAGNDGITSYRLGTIDFVYDNSVDGSTASQILTTEMIDTDGNNIYDYASHYYPTLCLLSTDNDHSSADLLSDDTDISSRTISGITIQYANINDFTIYVRRRRSSTAAVIDWHVTGGTQLQNGIADAAYIKFVSYSLDSDILNRALDALRIIP